MALTYTHEKHEVEGGSISKVIKATFTSVTGGAIVTGLTWVDFAVYVPRTSDKHGITYPNYSDTGTTVVGGTVYIDGVTANDVGYLKVWGR